ncbi:MAG: YncE family protein [Paludibacteraceae bacterium]|nr:YncE family protein [Paludibacteraceae bacterium]
MDKGQWKIISVALIAMVLAGCRHDEPVLPSETEQVGEADQTEIAGFYLLNEGNMGSNKATLDYYDYSSGNYTRNIYATANPNVVKELGDVGNDMQLYGERLYAVINCSNKIEVMDARTAKRIGQIDIPNCRYICFSGQYAYVTSYAGPVSLDPSKAQIGYVARIDTATLEITAQCLVGYQPDELAVVGDKLYVANSGGYMVPNYDHTVSVIDLNTFTEIGKIDVAPNLHRIRADRYGRLWVSSRGDYYDIPPKLFCIDPKDGSVVSELDVAASDMDIVGDSIYTCATAWDYIHMTDAVSYKIVDIKRMEVVSDNFITDGNDSQITKPYGVKINPRTREIFVTDAKNYVTPGDLYCFSPEGVLKWKVRTGDIPSSITFIYKQQ